MAGTVYTEGRGRRTACGGEKPPVRGQPGSRLRVPGGGDRPGVQGRRLTHGCRGATSRRESPSDLTEGGGCPRSAPAGRPHRDAAAAAFTESFHRGAGGGPRPVRLHTSPGHAAPAPPLTITTRGDAGPAEVSGEGLHISRAPLPFIPLTITSRGGAGPSGSQARGVR